MSRLTSVASIAVDGHKRAGQRTDLRSACAMAGRRGIVDDEAIAKSAPTARARNFTIFHEPKRAPARFPMHPFS